jgi:nucleoside-diphosphate-sugar epimerase
MKAVYTQKINIYGGEQYRPLICVKDIAGYIEEAIHNNNNIGTYILSQENVQMKVLAQRIASMVPFTKVEYTDMVFQDTRNYQVDNFKARNTFNYKMKHSIDDEVKEMIRIFKENRIRDVNSSEYNNGNYIKENPKL